MPGRISTNKNMSDSGKPLADENKLQPTKSFNSQAY